MKTYHALIEIQAKPEVVWNILTDSSQYADWDPTMIKIEGTIAPGETLTIYSKLAPKRAFKPKVTVFEPNRRMVWASGMPLGLFKGERTFALEPVGGHTRFSMNETFSGLLLPLFGGSIPDMDPVFREFCEALKARAEGAGG